MARLPQTHLVVQRQDDFVVSFTVFDEYGLAVDLSSATEITFTAKYDIRDADDVALISKTLGSGIEIGSASNIVRVFVAADDTLEIAESTILVWDLEVNTGSATRTAARGTLRVEYDVTRHDVSA